MAMESGGEGGAKYVQAARLCGIDGSFQVRTLLDKPTDDMLGKSTSGVQLLSGERLEGVV